MGTCTCVSNMQGIRCSAGLRQRMEVELVRQFASAPRVARGGNPCERRANFGHEDSSLPLTVANGLRNACGRESWLGIAWNSSCAPSFNPYKKKIYHFSRCSSTAECSVSGIFPHQVAPLGSQGTGWDSSPCLLRRWNSGWCFGSRTASLPRSVSHSLNRSWVESQTLCPGCGVEMQNEDPKGPGFYQEPVQVKKMQNDDEELFTDPSYTNDESSNFEDTDIKREGKTPEGWDTFLVPDFEIEDEREDEIDEGEGKRSRRVPGRRSRKGKSGKENENVIGADKPVVCARCHALRNYGKVKDESVENLLPDFDFEHVVGSRLRKSIGRRAVVLMVIDSVDFDGSFPRMAANLLADADKNLGSSWQDGEAGNVARLVIVLNKVDLLPGQISPVRLEQWVRRRSRAGGVSQISGVHIVSAFKGWGVDKLAKQVTQLVGPRGDVWVIGAQNVGKSSLINALAKLPSEGAEEKKNTYLTEAAYPGTTIGVLKLEGILPGRARLLDTPGLLHPHQITTRLTREEQKMVQIRKILKPRTFRVKVGHSVSVGGLIRLTVDRAPAESIYATIWASAFIPCHMGKAETVQVLYEKHVGEKLQPPLSKDRLDELGRWVPRTVQVSGDRWDKSSVDIAVAGVGWIALALSGSATLEVWTYEGVAVTVREAIVFDLAPVMEKPGFTPMKSFGKGKD